MPKGSPELTNARKEEIINACEALYKTESFKDITIKEIGNITSFTRTSIYNYFQTKEEIFLALLGREYDRMSDALEELTRERPSMRRVCPFTGPSVGGSGSAFKAHVHEPLRHGVGQPAGKADGVQALLRQVHQLRGNVP